MHPSSTSHTLLLHYICTVVCVALLFSPIKYDMIVKVPHLTVYCMCPLLLSAVKVADQIQKEITAKRSEVDNLRSRGRRLEEKIETLTKVRVMHLASPLQGNFHVATGSRLIF